MASITISDVRPVGADLFLDSESFLHQLTDQEIGDVFGGDTIAPGKANGGFVLLYSAVCIYW
ncbi:MAG: hypothetical protein RID53_08210 [Coleofasciculus sp. B1-GNL1-01]|uniref:hypothetical protein n=1 Tax=Coleofasciculus sp. B1-GNL1-01 TaxID=3068484 RepID=UPI0032F8805C